MNTAGTCQIESSSSDDTFEIGRRFGARCKGGEVFVLVSDLGGGKTTFTKGLARGLGSDDVVGSPTFTVSRVYKCRDGLYLHHFDFYRLAESGVVGYELAEVVDDPHAVIVIEWGDIVSDVLPTDRITLTIERMAQDENARCISISTPAGRQYIHDERDA